MAPRKSYSRCTLWPLGVMIIRSALLSRQNCTALPRRNNIDTHFHKHTWQAKIKSGWMKKKQSQSGQTYSIPRRHRRVVVRLRAYLACLVDTPCQVMPLPRATASAPPPTTEKDPAVPLHGEQSADWNAVLHSRARRSDPPYYSTQF
ncbi:hypothetical protein F4780DRAFT_704650 [Xylariomycetidae sp. FL0641]|nr:hypothetical protein F4780DRAFT_704650 [Xylariomycetidae sp. FL0641]